MKKVNLVHRKSQIIPELKTSRIPGFYRLPVERRLAYLARTFKLSEQQISMLRNGNALRVEHAVNMVENSIGIFGLPLGLGLNFIVDGREHLVPMAVEEASIIAAASKAALLIRKGGGFYTKVDDPVMIGQIQVLDLSDPRKSAEAILENKQKIIEAANESAIRMRKRGGGVFDIEVRVLDEDSKVGPMLIVHLLYNVCEAMGANAVNYACESAGPVIEEITGGRVNLRILSNLADRRVARAEFNLPAEHLATRNMSGAEVAQRMVEASEFARIDPYRAATCNKGIFNGVCAAAVALGQDWRAIEAGGHAYAARNGRYSSLTSYDYEDDCLKGKIELPMQVGWIGGAVNSHPGVRLLREISGVRNSRQLAGLLVSVGLGQNFTANLALATDGIQKGHMALHARSVAISVGVPANQVEDVSQEMIRRGEVKVAVAEEIYRRLRQSSDNGSVEEDLPVKSFAHGKVVLFGEHATVYNYPGITSTIDKGLTVRISHDPDGPRFVYPHFKQVFPVPKSEQDIRLFSKAADYALEHYGLQHEQIAIKIESDLIPGMGLGSSAAFSVGLCTALRRYKHLDQERKWDTGIFEDAQKLEAIFHGNPSGMDTATVLSEGVLWFRKGPPREILPIRVPAPAAGLLCIVEPGARTIELVERVQKNRERDQKAVDPILEEIGNITVDAGIALGIGDMQETGRLMFRNHEQLARLGVSTAALDEAVDYLLDKVGVLGAKMTGGGGGGAIVALVKPDTQYYLAQELSEHFPMVIPFELGAAT
ncbi:MAG: hydroxymethylglutaryl-CoA reductase, degradative [candidate division Zixibacteria bacterium]|nr:hydroxymethylglutaryl-CoA reductase, degradative [candidate division Zixibacteria bacterium]NIR64888.1 hydroxymethylglutaryl-CoA reductase, degradative [candidate division Zixibacteria bacterium]NIS17683.1 hydroxymethylglutaryl-CoA reductase, degradative [candidate division Zixibacteria bacterium]NIS46704.1 hydroxymethylglutaryl-CoA reductase, degradative [candidate division Zixibacteria bacterium]NIT54001.1 hydroxymethylglutaryl-CoA reductase, degradative [candidate division Zixibacteria ba